jgi:hypothetical protein
LGFVTRLLVYAALFFALYIFAPDDILDVPLATLTLSKIGRTVVWVVIGLVLIRWLFEPSEDDNIREAWGWLGVVLVAAVVVGSVVLHYMGR